MLAHIKRLCGIVCITLSCTQAPIPPLHIDARAQTNLDYLERVIESPQYLNRAITDEERGTLYTYIDQNSGDISTLDYITYEESRAYHPDYLNNQELTELCTMLNGGINR